MDLSFSIVSWINLFFFTFLTARALLSTKLNRFQRGRTIIVGALGFSFSLLLLLGQKANRSSALSYAADWLPALLMLLAYWQSGGFYTQPHQGLQARLERFDRTVFGRWPRWNAEHQLTNFILRYLELAYLFCYLLIPLGVAILYLSGKRSQVNSYWSVVLPPAYLCYGATAFFQTLPPRIVSAGPARASITNKVRRLNLWVVRHASIQINTFPSAHVAATVAASLALWPVSAFAAGIFLWISLSIAVATVACAYHYTADALAGAAVAVLSFCCYSLLN